MDLYPIDNDDLIDLKNPEDPTYDETHETETMLLFIDNPITNFLKLKKQNENPGEIPDHNWRAKQNYTKKWYKRFMLHRKLKPAVIEYNNTDVILNKSWYLNGILHSQNDTPAQIEFHENITKNDKGEFVKSCTTTEHFCYNGVYHRRNKPALIITEIDYIYSDEKTTKLLRQTEPIIKHECYLYDYLHNKNSEAIFDKENNEIYKHYYNNIEMSAKQFESIINNVNFQKKFDEYEILITKDEPDSSNPNIKIFYAIDSLLHAANHGSVEVDENDAIEQALLKLKTYKYKTEQINGNLKIVTYYNRDNNVSALDHPAIIHTNIDDKTIIYEEWRYNGNLHRIDGPAVIEGTNEKWYLNGNLHNIDGPAVIENGIPKKNYIMGKEIDKDNLDEDTELFIMYLFISLFINYLENNNANKITEIFDYMEGKFDTDKLTDEVIDRINITYTGGKETNTIKMPLLTDFTGDTIDTIKKYGIKKILEFLSYCNTDIFINKDNKIVLFDTFVSHEFFGNIKKHFSLDIYLISQLNFDFLTHGSFTHIFHQYIIFKTIKKFIKFCQNQIHSNDYINYLLKKCCAYMNKYKKLPDKNYYFEKIIGCLLSDEIKNKNIQIIIHELFKKNHFIDVYPVEEVEKVYKGNIWNKSFDVNRNDFASIYKLNDLNKLPDLNIISLRQFLLIPDHITFFLLLNNKWKNIYFITITSYYINLLMTNIFYKIIMSRSTINEFCYADEFQDIVNPKISRVNKITSHYRQASGRSLLNPNNMYHSRQIFLNVIDNINRKDASKLINLLSCENTAKCELKRFNYYESDYDVNLRVENLKKYIKYKLKYLYLQQKLINKY